VTSEGDFFGMALIDWKGQNLKRKFFVKISNFSSFVSIFFGEVHCLVSRGCPTSGGLYYKTFCGRILQFCVIS